MSKNLNQVDGFGYQCEQIDYEYQYSKSLAGYESLIKNEIKVKLSRESCLEMVKTRTCMGMQMNCTSDDECSLEYIPEETYNWLSTNTKYGHICSFTKRRIVADSFTDVLFSRSKDSCRAIDLFCEFDNHIIVWDSSIVNDCTLEVIMESTLFTSPKENLLMLKEVTFEIIGKNSICGKDVYETNEGLYISVNKKDIEEVKRNYKHIKTSLDFPLQNANMDNHIIKLLFNVNSNVCTQLRNLLQVLVKTTNFDAIGKFIVLDDTKRNKVVLHSVQNTLYLPYCVKIDQIQVEKTLNNCYEDLPISFKYQNKEINGFLTTDKIIRTTSRLTTCSNEINQIVFMNEFNIIKKGQKVYTINKEEYHKNIATVNLFDGDVSLLNYRKDKQIFEHLDLLKSVDSLKVVHEKKDKNLELLK